MDYESIFIEVDVDDDGQITKEDLNRYAMNHDLGPSFVKRWLHLFDKENVGRIDREKFRSIITIRNSVTDKVTILHEEIDEELKKDVLTLIMRNLSLFPTPELACSDACQTLNSMTSPYWFYRLNPPTKMKIDYGENGLVYFSLKDCTRILIYRSDNKRAAGCCGLCC